MVLGASPLAEGSLEGGGRSVSRRSGYRLLARVRTTATPISTVHPNASATEPTINAKSGAAADDRANRSKPAPRRISAKPA